MKLVNKLNEGSDRGKKAVMPMKKSAKITICCFSVIFVLSILMHFVETGIIHRIFSIIECAVLLVYLVILFYFKREKDDELSQLNRYKSMSFAATAVVIGLVILYFASAIFDTLKIRVTVYLACSAVAAMIVIREAAFLYFERDIDSDYGDDE